MEVIDLVALLNFSTKLDFLPLRAELAMLACSEICLPNLYLSRVLENDLTSFSNWVNPVLLPVSFWTAFAISVKRVVVVLIALAIEFQFFDDPLMSLSIDLSLEPIFDF